MDRDDLSSLVAERDKYHRQAQDLEHDAARAENRADLYETYLAECRQEKASIAEALDTATDRLAQLGRDHSALLVWLREVESTLATFLTERGVVICGLSCSTRTQTRS